MPVVFSFCMLLSLSVYFRVKEHKKGEQPSERVKQFVAYWLETAFKEKPHDKIVVLFDMGSTGLSNLVSVS